MTDASTPGYEAMSSDQVACLICGAVVWFAHMVTHTKWHESLELIRIEE